MLKHFRCWATQATWLKNKPLKIDVLNIKYSPHMFCKGGSENRASLSGGQQFSCSHLSGFEPYLQHFPNTSTFCWKHTSVSHCCCSIAESIYWQFTGYTVTVWNIVKMQVNSTGVDCKEVVWEPLLDFFWFLSLASRSLLQQTVTLLFKPTGGTLRYKTGNKGFMFPKSSNPAWGRTQTWVSALSCFAHTHTHIYISPRLPHFHTVWTVSCVKICFPVFPLP